MCYVPRHGEHARGSVAAVARTLYISWKAAASKLISQSLDLFYISWEENFGNFDVSSREFFLPHSRWFAFLSFVEFLFAAGKSGNMEFYCFCGIARNLPGFIFSQCAASEDKIYSKSLVHAACRCIPPTVSTQVSLRSTAWQCFLTPMCRTHSWRWQSSGAVCRTSNQGRSWINGVNQQLPIFLSPIGA